MSLSDTRAPAPNDVTRPGESTAAPLSAAGGVREVPSTEPQREVWLAHRLGPEASLAYNESVSLHLRGELDTIALRSALRELPARHDALRATIGADGLTIRAPLAAPAATVLADVPLHDLEALPPEARKAELAELARRHVSEPFDLEHGPLVRAELVRMAADHHVLVLTGHHVVLDGWSTWVLVKDLAALYALATGARTEPLPPAPSFIEYAAASAARVDSPEVHENERWWIERFAGGVPTLDLPTDRPRPAVRTTRAGRVDHAISGELLEKIKKLGAAQGAGLYATLLAGFGALLHRLTGHPDLVIGIPSPGQAAAGLEDLVGQCITMLPLGSRITRADRFADHVAAVKTAMLDAYDHQDVTFGRVLRGLAIPRDPSRLPLISVVFNIDQALASEADGVPGLSLELQTNPRLHETFELFINAVDTGAGLSLECQYNRDLFDAATVRRWLAAFETLLRGAVAAPDQAIGKLPILSETDRRALAAWNQSAADYPRGSRVEELILATARRVPDRVAVTNRGKTLTYGQLAGRGAAIAAALRARGVRPGDRVGLLVERDLDLTPSILGTLWAGAAYVPLDPSFPTERLRFMVEDAAVTAIVTTGGIAPTAAAVIGAVPVVLLGDVPAQAEAAPTVTGATEEAAYIIYTSGSTGKPKGVRVPHRSAVNLLTSVAREPGMSERDVVLAVTTLSFDIAVSELILPLVVGAKIVLADRSEVTDGQKLRQLVVREGVTFIDATPATWRLLRAAGWEGDPKIRSICTGEAMPRDLAADLAPRVELWNGYGPTETTVWSSFHRVDDPDGPILIGHPVANTTLHVLDEDLQPVPVGIVGELFIGGDGVTLGYLDRPELTAERFLPDHTRDVPGAKLYRTGDLARWRVQPGGRGALECLGRTDFQVKLRGYRIELGEIEVALARHPAIAHAAVITREDRPGDVRLIGYYVPKEGAAPPDEALKEHLGKTLPEYMIPSRFVSLAAMPLTGSGKVDRKALPAPSSARPELAQPYRAPANDREATICRAFGEVLGIDQVSALDGFFELGGNSLLSLRLLARLRDAGLPELSPATFFAAPSPAALARAVDGQAAPSNAARAARAARARSRAQGGGPEPIAIIGMAGRFPGAPDVETFWENLCAGRESIRYFAPHELDPSIPLAIRTDPAYVAARGVIDGVELFDAGFFGISPAEAQVMDPQHRLFMEVSWHALEHAGYVPETAPGPIGIFGGMYNGTYLQRHLNLRPDVAHRLGDLVLMLANEKDYITMRAAHRLGLTGPAISIHTSCSTALTATALAMDSLRNGSCDLALAGAAAVTCPPNSGYFHQEGSMASPDGHTRAFDAQASGTVFSDAVAMVVLRRLSDAIAAGDQIYAVLLGAGINNDGGERASFTAPNPEGQAHVIAAAHDAAGVDARTISYIEAHGTATPLGDPIEIEGLTRAFARHTQERGFCALGSVKSNIGHVVTVAGAAGMIKTALALHRRTLPPTINFTQPSPKIDFARTPFRVQTQLAPWPESAGPRRAGVSSFGFGGTNAHVVLEEAPPPVRPTPSPRAAELLLVSGKSEAALSEACANLARYFDAKARDPSAEPTLLADAAHTLQVGRRAFDHRRYVVAASLGEAARLFAAPPAEPTKSGGRVLGAELPAVGFVCPGQGSQYARMGYGLYHSEPAFRAAYDECCAILEAQTGSDPRAQFFSEDPQALIPTSVTQPAIFVLEYALARMWISWGVAPKVLIGHSVGEWVCAVLAEVMSLPDALGLVAERGRRMQELPAGSMLSVRLPAADLAPRLPEGVVIASENAPGLCVASGPTEAIAKLEAELGAADVVTRRLVTSHAFHSSMMDPVIEPLAALIAKVKLAAPKIPILSTVTARWLTDAEATSTRYWAEHLRLPVRFGPAAAQILADSRRVLIEIGPRATLSTLARQVVTGKRALPPAIPSLADSAEREPESVAAALGQLWSLGQAIDWAGYRGGAAGSGGAFGSERRRRVPLPAYPFQRQRHWVDPPAATAGAALPAAVAALAAPAAPAVAAAAAAFPAALPAALPTVMATIMSNATPTVSAPAMSAAPAAPVDRRPRLIASICELVEEVSGTDVTEADPATPWLELGLDSLALTQLALQVQRAHNVKVTFRQVMESYSTIASLAAMLDERLPPEVAAAAAQVASSEAPPPPLTQAMLMAQPVPMAMPQSARLPGVSADGPSPYVRQVIDNQLAVMAQQLALLTSGAVAIVPQPIAPQPAPVAAQPIAAQPAAPAPAPAPAKAPSTKNEEEPPAGPMSYDVKKAFGAIARIHTAADELTPQQRARLDALIARYTARTRKSKEYTAKHRSQMADPRVVNGFRPLTKELVYQLVVDRSRGCRLWDIDGNEYIDVLCGFGMSMFGWQPDFIREVLHKQIDSGYEIGPQHALAGDTARLFCELTGADRAAFCNTGSEAVMGTMRIARTVTGRSLIALFTGSYHGIFDEVIVRGTRKLRSIPAAPGIMPAASQNVLVLDYGTPESLEILRQRAHELAAILVEPVQSRRPDFAPVEFLRELRKLTEESGTVLIFDEVICGFRSHPKGAQGIFGIEADLASYGKVIGGGIPIGVIAGKRQYMDALDGGGWEYGDDSIPSVGVTYFAGTFVRHPLALAATHASLQHMRDLGPALQERLTAKTAGMVGQVNAFMQEIGAPFKLSTFASLWRNVFTEDLPYGDLIYVMLRDRGIHILDNFPCFLTTAHGDDDIAAIVAAYKAAATEMQASGFFPARATVVPVAAEAGVREAPSTEPQREVWLADRLGAEASLAYNESASLHFRGELDIGALRHAVRELPARHDALRAAFTADGMTMRSAESLELSVPLRDLEALPPAAREAELAAIKQRHVSEPFDLEHGPLVRAELVRLAADHHVLVFTGHHIVLDGWSAWVIVKDLAALYGIATGTRKTPLPAAPSYIDYAAACAARAGSAEVRENERWWIERFTDGVPALDLPTDRPRPPVRTTRAGREDVIVPADLLAQVKKMGASLGGSMFATLLAAFDVLLHRLTGHQDLVVGIPAAGQNATPGLESLVGHCVNMLPLRNKLARGERFADHVKAVRATMLDAYDHQDVTFGRVLQGLPIARDPSRLPLISVIFNIDQALSGEGHGMPGVAVEFQTNPRIHETFELFINAVDTGAGLRVECQYNSDLFDAATVRRWLAAYEILLRGIVSDPTQAIGKLPILSEADRRALAAWNRSEADYPRQTRVEELILATARRVPDRVAVKNRGKTLTYGQLARRAAAIAAELRAPGVRPGDRVGLLVERDLDLLPSLVGALSAGAAYVPLDPSFPSERLRFMVEDAGVAAIVTTSAIAAGAASVIGSVPVVVLDDVPAEPEPGTELAAGAGTAEDAAYIIYTSGSTGRPKGVRVPHRSVVNLLTSVAREPGMSERDMVLAVTTLSFDIAVSELILPLVVGATIVLADRSEATDGDRLRQLVLREGVTFIDATPATWRILRAAGWEGDPKIKAICTGEALPRDLAADLAPRVELWNGYGPTETTVWSSFHRVDDPAGPVLIGHPVANTTLHVLDEDLQPVPVGVVGELFIGGDGVTLGYLERPELTAERFLPDHTRVQPGAKLYRTGDLARWRTFDGGRDGARGALECLGRTDFQVKVRGYRIELGEIEVALARHPAIAHAAVITREDRPGDVRLVGYYVPQGGATPPSDEALKEHLGKTLPEYMVPTRFVSLAAMPLTGSGKVDRKALPAPSGPAVAGEGAAVAPRTGTEEVIARAYQEALSLPRVSIHDNFFALGGHSLLVAQMTAKLSQTLGRAVPMRSGFEHPTVVSLASWLDGARPRDAEAPPRIPRRADHAPAPLSLMQQRVWYLEQLQLGRRVFNVPSAHHLHGALDTAALGRAFAEMVARQPVLRTALGLVGDAPAQVIRDKIDDSIPFEDMTNLPEAQREPKLLRRLEIEVAQPFDLTQAPLYRVRLFKLGDDHHVLFFMPHHIIWDGWSFDLFYEEMSELYAAQLAKQPTTRPLPPVSYADFSVWHRDWMTGPELGRQLEFWRAKLAGAPDALDLPTDHPRPPIQSGDGATDWLKLPAPAVAALRTIGLREGATLFMTLLAAWSALLAQLTRQHELVIGTPVRGRNLPEVEKVMGFFVNALPLRLRVDPDQSFLELVRHCRLEMVEAFGAQDVPFEHLVRVLDTKRDESRFPIYQSFFSYQDARQRPPRWGNLQHHNLPVFQPAAAQDVALWFLDNVDGVIGGLNYNTDIIDAETAARWKRRFLALVEAIAADPDRPVRRLLEVTGEERAQLVAWNQTEHPLAPDATLTALLASIGQYGDRVAIRHTAGAVTYTELAALRDRVAAAIAARGLGRGDVVALLLERTPLMLGAVLGAIASGATYLPLDPGFPASRLSFMLEDSGAKLVITDVDLREVPLDPARVMRADEPPLSAATPAGAALPPASTARPDDAAYLIYTSGSTGRPKGVRVPQRAVVNFLAAMREKPGLGQSDRLVAVTTLSFDIAVLELLLPLTAGAEVILATREQATDGNALRGLLEQHRATIMQATPATWRILLESGWRGGAGFKALCGGEALPPELAEALLRTVGVLWNMYGPTETTVWSTCARVELGKGGGVTIGQPIHNTQVWILDEAGELVPIGVPGELYIGGDGVALGYHARPELTAERFVTDKLSQRPGARMYRTGDLARWRADGKLAHLGRTDFQVKVRGYRIELGEIEVALARHAQVAEAVVTAQPGPGGEQRLVAYLVPRGEAPQPSVLREHLRQALPDYMVPAVFVTLERLPLTPNGKVDRRALPAPSATAEAPVQGGAFRGPQTRAEQLVATVWRELLGVDRISVADNFLDLGGHSLLIMQAIAKLEARTGKRISPRAFIFQTLEQIAREYDAKKPEPPKPTPPAPAAPTSRLSRWLSALIPGNKS
ncbi:MAG TPA: amino acid adenylation domain-containing protein [Kofleriaceae bacterium]|nr:amino acid adenylation domain-containing protein [Kofleriaceae bacterium]